MIGRDPKVFISYRREETAGHAGRLYDVMSSRFGDSNVFMDVDIAPGVDFVNRITQAVGACHVLLVIIGPHWATISNGGTLGRIFEPGDFVRLEVQEGLRRSDIAVIPVLVGGARMPEPGALPAPLRALSRRNALELSDSRWRYDVDRLMAALEGLLANTSAVQPRPPPLPPPAYTGPPEPRPSFSVDRATLFLTTTAVAAIAGVVGSHLGDMVKKGADANGHFDKTARIVNEVGPAGVAWAVIGAAVAIWLAWRVRTRHVSLGWLVLGGLTGAVAGAAGAAVVALPRYLQNHDNHPFGNTRHQLTIVGVALVGAIIGSLVGWLWNRRGSAGLVVGLLAGALYEAAAYSSADAARYDLAAKAGLAAAVIVGSTAVTQALLDAWAERSPRALVSARGP